MTTVFFPANWSSAKAVRWLGDRAKHVAKSKGYPIMTIHSFSCFGARGFDDLGRPNPQHVAEIGVHGGSQ